MVLVAGRVGWLIEGATATFSSSSFSLTLSLFHFTVCGLRFATVCLWVKGSVYIWMDD